MERSSPILLQNSNLPRTRKIACLSLANSSRRHQMWFIRSSGDLISLMQEGGWRDIKLLQRYAAGDMGLRADQIAKTK
jgi:hypothetical protein